MLMRTRCKHFIPLLSLTFLYRILTFITYSSFPLPVKLAYLIPNAVALLVSSYSGSYFETHSKFDFLQRTIIKEEAEKLQWAAARDTSLLRNIFPKNLSDELESQMTQIFSPKKDNLLTSRPIFVERSLSSLAALKEQISQLENSIAKSGSSSDSEDSTIDLGLEFKNSNALVQVRKSAKKETLSVEVPYQSVDAVEVPPAAATIFSIPPIITTPSPIDIPSTPFPYLTTCGTPLHTLNHIPERDTYLSGTKHIDGSRIALSHSYPHVCVLLADIVGFTTFSSSIPPTELVTMLNELFRHFDDIMDFHHLEKIRTIGDAYLCVANMSLPLENAEQETIKAGMKMITAVHRVNPSLRLRVGIASGPLIAGVTGLTKWNYDIFGQSLAEATVMESMAPPNSVAITPKIYQASKDDPEFIFERIISADNPSLEYYVITVNPSLLNGFSNFDESIMENTNDLAILSRQKPSSRYRGRSEICGIQNHNSNIDDVSEEELRNNASSKFGFNITDLDRAETKLEEKSFNLAFSNQQFETEYKKKAILETHNYTTKLSILFALAIILHLFMEIGIYNGGNYELPFSVICAYITQFFIFVGYIVFAKYYDHHWTADYVACFVAISYSAVFVIAYHFVPTETHITLVAISVFSMGILTFIVARVPAYFLIVGQSIISAVALSIFRPDMDDIKHVTARIYSILIAFTFYGFMTLSQQEKISRKQFLAQKRIAYVMHHQKIAQKRAKLLLHNILPEDIIPRLQPDVTKNATVGVVDHFEEATIIDPSSRFDVYNELFTSFDKATKAIGLEKIKTINSVYMVASGLPKKIPNHVDMALKLAVELYSITSKFSHPLIQERFQIRIGLATGPVVAGIIGKKKYSYDCWSDVTNTASRMESNGWNGYLQMTEKSFELVKHKKYFKKRENLNIKGKGNMDAYVLNLSKFVP